MTTKKKNKSVFDFDEINRQDKTIFAEAAVDTESNDIEFEPQFGCSTHPLNTEESQPVGKRSMKADSL